MAGLRGHAGSQDQGERDQECGSNRWPWQGNLLRWDRGWTLEPSRLERNVETEEPTGALTPPYPRGRGGGSRPRSNSTCGWRNWRWVGFSSGMGAARGGASSPSPRCLRLIGPLGGGITDIPIHPVTTSAVWATPGYSRTTGRVKPRQRRPRTPGGRAFPPAQAAFWSILTDGAGRQL